MPDLFLNYNFNDNHNLSYLVSNKTIQPNYWNLNPHKIYTTPTDYSEGNPYLKSRRNIVQELTYTLMNKFLVRVRVQNARNIVRTVNLPVGENGMKQVFMNQDKADIYALQFIMFGSYFNNIWQANNFVALDYNTEKGFIEDIDMSRKGFTWRIGLYNDFVLTKKLGLVLTTAFFYQGRYKSGIYIYEPTWNLSLGLKKTFGNLSISLNMNDIFNTMNNKIWYEYEGTKYVSRSHYVTRALYINIGYSFGNQKARGARNKNKSNADALSRIQ